MHLRMTEFVGAGLAAAAGQERRQSMATPAPLSSVADDDFDHGPFSNFTNTQISELLYIAVSPACPVRKSCAAESVRKRGTWVT